MTDDAFDANVPRLRALACARLGAGIPVQPAANARCVAASGTLASASVGRRPRGAPRPPFRFPPGCVARPRAVPPPASPRMSIQARSGAVLTPVPAGLAASPRAPDAGCAARVARRGACVRLAQLRALLGRGAGPAADGAPWVPAFRQEYIDAHGISKTVEEVINATVKAKASEPCSFMVRRGRETVNPAAAEGYGQRLRARAAPAAPCLAPLAPAAAAGQPTPRGAPPRRAPGCAATRW